MRRGGFKTRPYNLESEVPELMKGIKRLVLVFLIAACPLLYAEPVSLLQDTPFFLKSIPPPAASLVPERIQAPEILYGIASWYSQADPGINLQTANGEIFEDSEMTCASWEFAFGTYLEVTNLGNGKSVICRVNDRGPSKRLNRLVDLTQGAFRKIEKLERGLTKVSVTPVEKNASS